MALDLRQTQQLRCYLDLLLAWNRRIALISQRRPEAIICKHFADSLVAASLCRGGERVTDLGSGAGFPGLPVAIARPEASVCLIEATGKKVSFLLNVIAQATVSNATVAEGRIERLAQQPQFRGRSDMVISRASFDIASFLSLAKPFLAPGGRAIAMKGPCYAEELGRLSGAPPPSTVTSYRLPDGSERVLLTFRFT
ncbi:MAG: 16S rRNA (guanine(527)-N(7))-methyltransferase RsmG [Acidobacteria bacterium RBG_16_68_9]|nr:MAG: 16S rRNA (guanine(527)-N(7))-methyltransferase RsmG [Acidobacteria bacterium RBG_16_68_9]